MTSSCPRKLVFTSLTENRLVRDTLARLLRKRSEINVVGVSRLSDSVKDEILSSPCDVVLTDCFDNTARSTFLRDVLDQAPESSCSSSP